MLYVSPPPLQEEGGDHAHAQSVHAAGGEADDAHQHRLHHHLQHPVWGKPNKHHFTAIDATL